MQLHSQRRFYVGAGRGHEPADSVVAPDGRFKSYVEKFSSDLIFLF